MKKKVKKESKKKKSSGIEMGSLFTEEDRKRGLV